MTHYVSLKQSFAEAMAAPRLHTEGTESLKLQTTWADHAGAALRDLGYQVTTGAGARISAVAWENDQPLREIF